MQRIDLLFHSVMSRFISIPARQQASEDCSMARMRVLWIIDYRRSATPGEIARVLGVSRPTATGLVDPLVRAGYVRRERSARDRRQVVLTLLPRARRVMADFARRRREKFRRLLRVVDPADARRLAGALATVNEILAKGTS